MKVFYHGADLDGIASGAILKDRYPEAELFPINYGDKFPWKSVEKDETVFMVDFCLEPFTDAVKLNLMCNLILIDHHKTVVEAVAKAMIQFNGIQTIGKGACELVWNYLYPDKVLPNVIYLLSRYDVWEKTNPLWETEIVPFQYGIKALYGETLESFDNWFYSYMMEDEPLEEDQFLTDVMLAGDTVLQYLKNDDEAYMNIGSFETELDGHKCLACNRLMTGSMLFASKWDESKYDIMIAFGYRKGGWGVSLYTTKNDVDVSVIAHKFGGGGHRQAAGFTCSELPFKI